MEHNKRSSFSGKLGYVLSAAEHLSGWEISEISYLAAKYGGGIFLLIYILLALTFSAIAMIVAETAIGRMTKKPGGSLFPSFGNRNGCLQAADQRDHSCADRTVLFRNRWLGHQISG